MDPEFWFRPKARGYGAIPTNWKGWAATGIYIFGVLLSVLAHIAAMLASSPATAIAATAIWLGFLVLWSGGFLALARAKTDGEWRWR